MTGPGMIGMLRGGESQTKGAAVMSTHPADALTRQIAPLPGSGQLSARKGRRDVSLPFGQHNLAAMGPAFFSMGMGAQGGYGQ